VIAGWVGAIAASFREMLRFVVVVVGLLLLVATLAGIKGAQIAMLVDFGKKAEKAGPPPEAVSVVASEEQEWEATLFSVGSIAADQGVSISNDAPGVVSRIAFESGQRARKGRVLVELDASVERAQLASSRAKMGLAELSAKRSRALVASGAAPPSQLDNDDSAWKAAVAEVSALEAQIDRKIVRAPFAGKLGIRAVNVGQYLGSGTPVTVLEALESVYVDFTLPQQHLPNVHVETPVRVTLGGLDVPPREGTVTAIDPTIDQQTRTFKVRASVANEEERLRPGMFANVSVVLPKREGFVVIPQTAVVHASYGDSVFIVEDAKEGGGKVVRQQFVRLGAARGDFVAVLEGVRPGQEVVSAGAFKLRNGSRVDLKPDVKPTPQLEPHLENR
jgi:membrane fusion protein (multidrug efflux system)